MVRKNRLPGLRTEYVTPHVCARCMEHIADDWEYCPYCGEPTGLLEDKEKDEMTNLNQFAEEVHKNAVEHGWWDEERSFGEIIALCHSELSEALEEYRNNRPQVYYWEKGSTDRERSGCSGVGNRHKPEGVAVELADCIIRILDYCGKENIDIDAVLKMKHEYNKTRPHKHGGKRI